MYMNDMPNKPVYASSDFSPEIRERVAEGVGRHFKILDIFGTWVFCLSFLGTIGFVYSFLTDKAYQEGLFEFLIFRIILLLFAMPFLLLLMFGTYKLMTMGKKAVRRVESGDFAWREGIITRSEVVGRRKNRHLVMEVDGERCEPIGDYRYGTGEEVYVIYLGAESKGNLKSCNVYVINKYPRYNDNNMMY